MKPLFLILITVTFFTTLHWCCKKGNITPPLNHSYRVKSTLDGSDKKIFTYDVENKLTRIDFNGGSFRMVYTSNEITAQTYFENGSPDPSWKYKFAVNQNKIVSGFRYQQNGAISRDYTYGYDNEEGRLAFLTTRIFDFTGDASELHAYWFTYNADNNLEKISYRRELKTGSTMQKSDSSVAIFNYYNDKKFITWKQIGFDFFGKISGGIQLTGLETMPFSFLFQEKIIPFEKATHTINTKKFVWNPGSNSWGGASSNNQTYPETDYRYGDKGLLVKYKNINIEWEAYQ